MKYVILDVRKNMATKILNDRLEWLQSVGQIFYGQLAIGHTVLSILLLFSKILCNTMYGTNKLYPRESYENHWVILQLEFG
jgi:hypothetical protein